MIILRAEVEAEDLRQLFMKQLLGRNEACKCTAFGSSELQSF